MSEFTDFFRNASSEQKRTVFEEVIKRATQDQIKLLDK